MTAATVSCEATMPSLCVREPKIYLRTRQPRQQAYLPTEVSKVLERLEKEKKGKYLTSCLEMRKHFTPLIYSVDGVAGRQPPYPR